MPSSVPTAPKYDSKQGRAALLIIDLINAFDFKDGKSLKAKANEIVEPVQRLRKAIEARRYPVIYVNDNFGEWHSDKSKLVEHAAKSAPELIGKLAPRDDDYFVIKPQFSGFYATNLPLLLPKLGVSRLILTGVATDICVLFTAADAHMRDYALWVPSDAVAAEHDGRATAALEIMHEHLGAETASTSELDLPTWMARLNSQGVR